MIVDAIGIGVFNWLTFVTAAFAFFLPSVWMVGGVASAVAIIGVVVFSNDMPSQMMISGWLIGQLMVGLSVHMVFRKRS